MDNGGADQTVAIRNAYGRAKATNANSYKNPLGGYTTADVRDKSMRSTNMELDQNMGIDLANAAQQNAESKFGRQATVAGFTQPQMYGSGSVTKQSDPMGTALQIGQMASSVGQAALL